MIALLLACSDQSFTPLLVDPWDGEAILVVEPLALDFWTLESGDEATQSFVIRNVGGGLLAIDELVVEGDPGFSLPQGGDRFGLGPEESREVPVLFSPLQPNQADAHVWVRSDAPVDAEQRVTLTGGGRVPWLVVTPDAHDWGQVAAGCPDELELVVQNVGDATLWVDHITSTGDPQVRVDDVALELGAGAFTTVDVVLTPGVDGAAQGQVTFDSNDPRGLQSVTQTFEVSGAAQQAEQFTALADPPIDLLFLVDQSGSMDDDQALLAANFQGFVTALEAETGNWQVGVVTYDHGCVNGGVLDASTPDYAGAFADAVTAGEDREITNDEALLRLADRALSQLSGCNAGLHRPGALLHVVVVSDEPERSWEQAAAWTWDYWVPRLQDAVAPDPLMISGVVDQSGCSEGDAGYAEAIAETGGDHLDICSSDWSAHVASLADTSLVGLWVFELAQEPLEASIQVDVDGTPTTDFVYDPVRNAVVMDSLESGQTVDVRYVVAGDC